MDFIKGLTGAGGGAASTSSGARGEQSTGLLSDWNSYQTKPAAGDVEAGASTSTQIYNSVEETASKVAGFFQVGTMAAHTHACRFCNLKGKIKVCCKMLAWHRTDGCDLNTSSLILYIKATNNFRPCGFHAIRVVHDGSLLKRSRRLTPATCRRAPATKLCASSHWHLNHTST